ncbi:MAG: hypothetical protein QXZ38_04035 [Candidatus Micrarchaeaceae archaeon]
MERIKTVGIGASSVYHGKESQSRFNELLHEELEGIGEDKITAYILHNSIGVIDGPSREDSRKIEAIALLSNETHVVLEVPEYSNKYVEVLRSLKSNILVNRSESAKYEPILYIDGHELFQNEIDEIISAALSIQRDIFARLAFGRRYSELTETEKYELIAYHTFHNYDDYSGSFKVTLKVPDAAQYKELVERAAKSYPQLVSTEEDSTVKMPLVETRWGTVSGADKVAAFFTVFNDVFNKELDYRLRRRAD